MARFSPPRGAYTVTIDRDMVNVTCEHDTLDGDWEDQCPNGHDVSLRTALHVVDASHWCDGTEGFAHHDPHEHVDDSHWECAICHAHVHPRIIPGGTPRYIPGLISATISGVQSTGREIKANIPEAWANIAGDLLRAELEVQLKFLDEIPEEWIYFQKFSS